MHKDLSCKHVGEASRILLQNFLVVFTRKLIHKNLQTSHRIVLQDITSTTYTQCNQNLIIRSHILKTVASEYQIVSKHFHGLQFKWDNCNTAQEDSKNCQNALYLASLLGATF
jgi:hypothetical protein